MIIIVMVMVIHVLAIVGIAAAGQAGAEVAREREPEAVSESQGWRSTRGGRLMSSQGRWVWGAGAGAGQRSDRTAAPRWLNKLAVRQDLRGGYGYGYRHGYRYRDGIAACARAGRRVAKKKAVVGLGFAHVYAIPVGRYPSSRDMFQGPRDWGNACRRLAE